MDKATKTKLENKLISLDVRKQREFRKLQALYDLTREIPANPAKLSAFTTRFEHIDKISEEFTKIQSEIIDVQLFLDSTVPVDSKALESFDDIYYEVKIFAASLKSTVPLATVRDSKPSPRLPKINIPTFDGSYQHWVTFHDTYLCLVHENESLSNIEKFHYLITLVSGPASSIVTTVPITATNYVIVWQALIDKYHNKRVLATKYLDEIFEFRALTSESSSGLNTFLETFQTCVTAVRHLNIPDLGDFVLLYIALRNLDRSTRKLFEMQNQADIPSYDSLIKFIQSHSKVLELSNIDKTSNKSPSVKPPISSRMTPPENKVIHARSFVAAVQTNTQPCPCCKQQHSIYKCPDFLALESNERQDRVRSLRLCFNCLKNTHMSNQCPSKIACYTCNSRHHTLLHSRSQRQTESRSDPPSSSDAERLLTTASTSCHALSSLTTTTPVLLSTASVHCKDVFGSYQLVRVLIDSGAQSSFITLDCARRLGLSLRRSTGCIAGLGQTHVQTTHGVTTCVIKPRDSEHPKLTTEAIVLSTITTNMPVIHIPPADCAQFKHLVLADPQFNVPGPIDFLLGADLYPEVFTGEKISGCPTALLSIYGWVITGKVNTLVRSPSTITTLLASVESPLDINMRRLWEIEEPPHVKSVNPEDKYCEDLFTTRHYRDQSGRYVVPLPFKEETPTLGESYPRALSRFQQLERRLARQPSLQQPYEEFMREYEELGHMTEVSSSTTPSQYVIPHHPVLKMSSSTTKLRVVFDASAKASCNTSLNDILFTGPKLQAEITDVILKFRMHAIVFSADICKMYRQILVVQEHRPFQHILWRNSTGSDVKRFELNTVTYGISSAPWLAIRTLHQLAQDEGAKFPDAAKVLEENIYVDDVLAGADSIEEALSLKRQLIDLLNSGGFQLRKWSSNCPELLYDVPLSDREVHLSLHSPDDSVVKILGIHWDAQEDAFSYKITLNTAVQTKRSLLSVLARIYDPLGWVTPAVFNAKCLIQTLWSLGLGWDDPIPSAIHDQWMLFATQLDELAKLRIKRCIVSSHSAEVNLVGFCDASEKGYAAVIYLHTTDSSSKTNVSLLMGKSKVAPLKTLSIPRLELCGAVLLSKLLQYALSILNTKVNRTYAFTDSATVLAWLRTAPYKLKSFISNRVVQIIEVTEPTMWNYVSTDHNPADCASRGLTPRQLVTHPMWWEGPTWLSSQRDQWPVATVPCLQPSDIPEVKTSVNMLATAGDDPASDIMERFSSLTTLKRVTAWCFRFVTNSQSPEGLRSHQGTLTLTELRKALNVWIRHVQNVHFSKEFDFIAKKKPCSPYMRRLNPFVDDSGFLRVGGRLRNASLPYNARHPLLLPSKNHLTSLIIDHYHHSYLHIGPRALQSVLQRQFWIFAARRVIRSRLSKCLTCHKMKAAHVQPLMGDLPASRVEQGRPFLTVGLDFAGPFSIKESKRRNAKISKAYMCLFVCMATKAVHLEVVSDLSTPAFLAALDRFVSRRGLCSAIYSDCGTNFVGANRYLMGVFKYLHDESNQIVNATASKGIQWHFNPPSAPHFGGLWEAGVRSVKYHLRRVIGDQALTFEELDTLFNKIEAILNSRPLFDLSPDANEFDTLTPGHFLIGAPLVSLPEENFVDTPMNRLSRWQLLQKITQHFWNKWKTEYLHTLQQRLKWSTSQPNLKTNDLVIINDGKSTPLQWKLGRIVAVHPGPDKVVRVATVRTSQGTLKRPVVKLCPLPSTE